MCVKLWAVCEIHLLFFFFFFIQIGFTLIHDLPANNIGKKGKVKMDNDMKERKKDVDHTLVCITSSPIGIQEGPWRPYAES